MQTIHTVPVQDVNGEQREIHVTHEGDMTTMRVGSRRAVELVLDGMAVNDLIAAIEGTAR